MFKISTFFIFFYLAVLWAYLTKSLLLSTVLQANYYQNFNWNCQITVAVGIFPNYLFLCKNGWYFMYSMNLKKFFTLSGFLSQDSIWLQVYILKGSIQGELPLMWCNCIKKQKVKIENVRNGNDRYHKTCKGYNSSHSTPLSLQIYIPTFQY